MKKWLLVLAIVIFASNAMAYPRHGRNGHHYRPAPIYVVHDHYRPVHYEYRDATNWSAFFAGLVGSTVGNYLVTTQYQPTVGSNTRCLVMQSLKTNRVVEKCVNTFQSQQEADIYRLLYVD